VKGWSLSFSLPLTDRLHRQSHRPNSSRPVLCCRRGRLLQNRRQDHLRQSPRATPEPPSPTTAPVVFFSPLPPASALQPAPEAAPPGATAPEAAAPEAAEPDAASPETTTNENSEPVQSSTPPSDASTIPPAPPFSKYLPTCTFKVICRYCCRDNHDICYRQCPSCYKKREVLTISDGNLQILDV
jgi:hypothetical protein